MEPIRVYRNRDGGDFGTTREGPDDEEFVVTTRADFDALAADAADARTLRAERDSLVKERERANQSVIESLAIARKALEENDRAEAVLIDKAGVDGDDLAACCEALLVQRDAATARADKAEAALRDIAAELREDGYVVIPDRIDAHLERKA